MANTREAPKYLTICIQSHDERLLNLNVDRNFASLHGNSTFEQLLAKIGLPLAD